VYGSEIFPKAIGEANDGPNLDLLAWLIYACKRSAVVSVIASRTCIDSPRKHGRLWTVEDDAFVQFFLFPRHAVRWSRHQDGSVPGRHSLRRVGLDRFSSHAPSRDEFDYRAFAPIALVTGLFVQLGRVMTTFIPGRAYATC
jgi:hypothetical protein